MPTTTVTVADETTLGGRSNELKLDFLTERVTARAILEDDRRCQVAVVLASVAGSRDAVAARSRRSDVWRDQHAHDALGAALVRRRLPLTGADVDHLLAADTAITDTTILRHLDR